MNVTLFFLTLFCYLLSALYYLWFFISRREQASKAAFSSLLVGLSFHTASLISRVIESGYLPLSNLYEAMNFFSWSIILFYLIAEFRYKIQVLGLFIVPIAFISIAYAAILPKEIGPLTPSLRGLWLGIHVTPAFLGNAALALAFGGAVMYLIQERGLKLKRPGGVCYRLPSLEILDDLNYKSLVFGFPLLTLGIITGSLWAKPTWGSYWHWDPKETFSLATWFIYAFLLHGRLLAGWRGKKAAILAIIGFSLVLFTFLGVNLLFEGLHKF